MNILIKLILFSITMLIFSNSSFAATKGLSTGELIRTKLAKVSMRCAFMLERIIPKFVVNAKLINQELVKDLSIIHGQLRPVGLFVSKVPRIRSKGKLLMEEKTSGTVFQVMVNKEVGKSNNAFIRFSSTRKFLGKWVTFDDPAAFLGIMGRESDYKFDKTRLLKVAAKHIDYAIKVEMVKKRMNMIMDELIAQTGLSNVSRGSSVSKAYIEPSIWSEDMVINGYERRVVVIKSLLGFVSSQETFRVILVPQLNSFEVFMIGSSPSTGLNQLRKYPAAIRFFSFSDDFDRIVEKLTKDLEITWYNSEIIEESPPWIGNFKRIGIPIIPQGIEY